MKSIEQRDRRKAFGVCLFLLGIAALIGPAVCAYGTQEKPELSMHAATKQVSADDGTTSRDKETGGSGFQHRDPRYELCAGDAFDLTFPFTPEFNQTVTVQPDGYITLTGAGDIHVAGKTVPELRELLKTAYANVLHDPVINVVLKDFQKPYFIAGGQIGHPGKYDLRDDTTLTQAIAIAGGFEESSKHSQVLLFRRVSNDWVKVKVLNVKKMLQAGNLSEDLHLQSGDMFFVPQNRVSKYRKWTPIPSLSMSAYSGAL